MDDEIKAAQAARRAAKQASESTQRSAAESDKASMSSVSYDTDIFETGGKGSRFANHDLSIDVGGGDDDMDDDGNSAPVRLLDSCEFVICSTSPAEVDLVLIFPHFLNSHCSKTPSQ